MNGSISPASPWHQRIFYGWVIVAAMFVINFSTMATGNLNFGLFVIPMGQELGMSRSQFGWAQTARRLSAGIASFFVGRLLDRYGPRIFIAIAAAVIGVCLLLISQVNHAWQFILLFGVIGISGLAAPNSLVTSVPVAKWFLRKRGRALALATAGLGIGGIVMVPVSQYLIDRVGWRDTWVIMAIIFMSMSIPLAILLLRRQPEDLGLTVDGLLPTNPQRPVSHTPEPEWTVREALHTPTLWLLMLVFGLAGLAQGGASIHRIPYWVEKGFDPQVVSFSFSMDAAGAAFMALVAGSLADRFPIRFIATASYLGFVVAIVLMLIGRNEFFLFGSTSLFGTSVGAGMIVHSYIFAAYYGRAFLGTIRGIVMPITLLSAGIGAPLSGYMRDLSGSYISSWWLILSVYLLCALIMFSIRPPTSRRPGVAPHGQNS